MVRDRGIATTSDQYEVYTLCLRTRSSASQRDRAMLSFGEYFAKSLNITHSRSFEMTLLSRARISL